MLNIVCFKPSLKVKDIQKRKNMFLTRQFKVEFKTYIYLHTSNSNRSTIKSSIIFFSNV